MHEPQLLLSPLFSSLDKSAAPPMVSPLDLHHLHNLPTLHHNLGMCVSARAQVLCNYFPSLWSAVRRISFPHRALTQVPVEPGIQSSGFGTLVSRFMITIFWGLTPSVQHHLILWRGGVTCYSCLVWSCLSSSSSSHQEFIISWSVRTNELRAGTELLPLRFSPPYRRGVIGIPAQKLLPLGCWLNYINKRGFVGGFGSLNILASCKQSVDKLKEKKIFSPTSHLGSKVIFLSLFHHKGVERQIKWRKSSSSFK